jgi:hypothetical protein
MAGPCSAHPAAITGLCFRISSSVWQNGFVEAANSFLALMASLLPAGSHAKPIQTPAGEGVMFLANCERAPQLRVRNCPAR